MILEFDDWLDGIHKTAVNSVQNKEIKGGETHVTFVHSLSLITREASPSLFKTSSVHVLFLISREASSCIF